METTNIRQQAKDYIDRLSAEKLVVATDFLAYLAEREINEATEELLNIPGFRKAFAKAKKDVAEGKLTDWRSIRNDV